MAKKTFMDNLDAAAANPALSFIGDGAAAAQPSEPATEPSAMPLARYDFHRAQEEKQKELAALRAQAMELDEQARMLKRKANLAKIAATAAANLEARRSLTTKYRNKPDYANPRSKRVNLLIRPDLYTVAQNFCDENRISFNHLMEVAVEEFVKAQRLAALREEGDGRQ